MFNFLKKMFKNFFVFSAAYSNNSFPEPLSRDEEEQLLIKKEANDKSAREKLIEHNLRLVAHIVKKYDNKKIDTDDLISIGTIGLIKGIDSYHLNKNTKLTTYAARCIENEILMYFRNNKKREKDISINESIGYDKEGNEITILDILKTQDPDFALSMHNSNNILELKKYYKILTPKEKEIIKYRYGLEDTDEITQKEIAKKLGISRSYVSRIEKRALTKMLKEFLKNNEEL